MESIQPILRCRYSYDPLDRLISQLQPDAPAHQRFYCKSRLATEIQGAIRYSIVQHEDLLLAQHRRQSDVLDTTLLASDQQRSVLNLLNTDIQRQAIAYTPYGHRRAESGLSSLLGFNGERPEPVTGCYLLGNGYRAFNPVLMRFNSPDSLSPFRKGGLNSYAYCLGDPINRSDPNGSFSTKILAAIKKWQTSAQNRGLKRVKLGYMSGPETVFSHNIVKTENTVMSDGRWTELTKTINYLGAPTQTRHVVGNGSRVYVRIGDAPGKSYKQNPSLQELSYSKTSATDLQQLPRKLTHQQTDLKIDSYNIYNAAADIQTQLMNAQGLTRGIAFVEAANIAHNRGINGELMGVHPTKAKIIRDEWNSL
ncbi:RHS repeat-associated core domain-containing protein [Pseudomonas sp. IT-P4]|uniref:RHS repeat-associated core domain-containing protein n=1 Tax=Pseudomonas sp. IT-P4 TaxID=3026446 RepID=UPI0039E00E9D